MTNQVEGMLAVRSFSMLSQDGAEVEIVITLCDPVDHESPAAQFAERQGALAYGLISIMGIVGAPAFPVLWVYLPDRITLTPGESDPDLTPVLRGLIHECLPRFFSEIEDVAPELCQLVFTPRSNLH